MEAMNEERFIADGKLEAKVVGKTENDKGWYLRLLLHPSDVEEITKLRFGAVLDIRWREVLNVEVEPIEVRLDRAVPDPAPTVPRPQANEAGISKPKKRFEELPLSQQAAMRCGEDYYFHRFLKANHGWDAEGDKETAAIFVRNYCGVASRSMLSDHDGSGKRWLQLERDYQSWLTDQRHEESIRR